MNRDRQRGQCASLFTVKWKRGRVAVTDVMRALIEWLADLDCEGTVNRAPPHNDNCRDDDLRVCASCAARASLGRPMAVDQ